jgi:hypothetical protein
LHITLFNTIFTSQFKALAAAASRPSCLASKAGLSYAANAAGAGQVTASRIKPVTSSLSLSFPARGFFTKVIFCSVSMLFSGVLLYLLTMLAYVSSLFAPQAASSLGNTGWSSSGCSKYRCVLFVGGLNGGVVLIAIRSPLQNLPGPEEPISDTSPLENGELSSLFVCVDSALESMFFLYSL